MTKKTTMKLVFLSVAVLGLALSASAQSSDASPPAPTPAPASGTGLLGQTYAGLTYTYTDIPNTSLNNQGLRFQYNEPVSTGLDALFTYEGDRSARFDSTRNTFEQVGAAAVAYLPEFARAKPFVLFGAGWIWTHAWGVANNSFAGQIGTGVEFRLSSPFVLTPYVTYTDAKVFAGRHRWNYGVKANYWLSDHWGVTATVDRDNHQDTGYGAGVNFRF